MIKPVLDCLLTADDFKTYQFKNQFTYNFISPDEIESLSNVSSVTLIRDFRIKAHRPERKPIVENNASTMKSSSFRNKQFLQRPTTPKQNAILFSNNQLYTKINSFDQMLQSVDKKRCKSAYSSSLSQSKPFEKKELGIRLRQNRGKTFLEDCQY